MNQEDIFKKIGQILNELNDQYEYLARNPKDLNELEMDLFLANASFLSQHVHIIKRMDYNAAQHTLAAQGETPRSVSVTLTPPPPVSGQFKSFEKETALEKGELVEKVGHVEEGQQVENRDEEYAEKDEQKHTHSLIEEEIFRIDKEPSTFEFILSDRTPSDKFEFEEKSVDEIFDRPLSIEEEEIIARKQKLREKIDQEALEFPALEEDEIGPEPFLVAETTTTEETEEEPLTYEVPEIPQAAPEPEEAAEVARVTEAVLPKEPNLQEALVPQEGPAKETEPIKQEEQVMADGPIIVQQQVIPAIVEEKEPEPLIAAQPVIAAQAYVSQVTPVTQTPVTKAYEPVSSLEPTTEKPATLNDILAGKRTGTPVSGSNRTEIKDLKQAISLNDKLRYIKDLFNGYNLAYAEAIDLLNKMPDFNSADAFLQKNYALKNNWASKQDTADQFYELLNRRFPAK